MIKSFDHVAITVKDFEESIDWYVKNMGFSVNRRIENMERGVKIAFLEVNGQVLLEFFGFFDSEKVIKNPMLKPEDVGIKHISFFVDSMDETCKKLKNVGVDFITFTPGRSVFKDPNGILIELRIS